MQDDKNPGETTNDTTKQSSDLKNPLTRLVAWSLCAWRPWVLVGILGAVLYFPWLGSSGLWDPWEPHYAEVAREMVESGNYLEPTWEHSLGQSRVRKHFFSKPVLPLWLMAAGMKVFGVHASDGSIVSYAEWYIRFPFALLAIVGMIAVFALGRRFFSPQVGLLAAVVLGTCPQYYFIARQAMTDMPLVSLVTTGMVFLMLGGLDDRPRAGLLYLGYASLGLAALAKGVVALLFPGLVFLLYFILSGDWRRLKAMRVFTGGALSLLVASPWYVYLSIASVKNNLLDDEGKTFFQRFFLHDQLYRLASGVHGDRGTFAYFIKQLGLGTHPWFPVMIWGWVQSAVRLDGKSDLDRSERVELLVLLWALAAYGLYSFSVTKFHHYALPAVPAMAVLAALWLHRIKTGHISLRGKLTMLLFVLLVVLISRDIGLLPQSLVDLFVYNYTRPFPKPEALVGQVGFSILFGAMSLGLVICWIKGQEAFRKWAGRLFVTGALLSSVWGGWYFFNAMGPHWSQKHLFETYFALRKPSEPIGAYMMNWRGETFYSRNQVSQLKNNTKLKTWLRKNQGKRLFLLVERKRLRKLKDQLPVDMRTNVRVLDRTCNKFFLISVHGRE